MSASFNYNNVLNDLNGFINRINDKTILNNLGEIGKNSVKSRIGFTKKDPNGGVWSKWSKSRLKQRVKKGNVGLGLLFDTGKLFDSIKLSPINNNSIEIFSNLKYASYLNDGNNKLPKREFMSWSVNDSNNIYKVWSIWVTEGRRL